MPPEEPVQQVSLFSYLATNSPLPVVAVGLILVVIGIILVVSSKSRMAAKVYALVSPLPGILALVAIHGAHSRMATMASSSVAPKPAEFMGAVSAAVTAGFSGLIATILAMGLAIVAISRVSSRSAESSMA